MPTQKSVLLIDDNVLTLELTSTHLRALGFTVGAANSGKDGLDFLKNNKVDIVILDLIMPGMDGYEVLKHIRSDKNTSATPVIVLTGRYSQSDKIKSLDKGADDYIIKPFDNNELASRINAVLRRYEPKAQKALKKILITGGAGFIGSHLARKLLSLKHEVFIIDDFSTGREENIKDLMANTNFHLIRGSITDDVLLNKSIENCDLIYHLAATVGVKNVVENPLETLIYDTIGTELVLKYASARGIKVLITSTSEVYGKSEKLPFSEEDDIILGPPSVNRWSYACSKLLDEFLAVAYHKERNLSYVLVRLFNVVGPGQVGKYGMVIPRFFKNAFNNTPITIYGTGNQVRCFTYVDDIVDILIKLPTIEAANCQLINLGSTNEITIKDLALQIKKITNSNSPIVYEPYESYYGDSFQDIKKRVPDLSKLKSILGKLPSIDMDTILVKTLDYYKKHPEEIENI